jgi:hypothetical protein
MSVGAPAAGGGVCCASSEVDDRADMAEKATARLAFRAQRGNFIGIPV